MKKTRLITAAIGLCMAASLMAGCSGQSGSSGSEGGSAEVQRLEGGQTQITVEAAGAVDSYEGEYGFIHNGYKIVPGMTWDDAISVLGDDYDQMVRADCASNEMGYVYWYDGFNYKLYSKQAVGSSVEIIEMIEMSDPLIDCGGFHIGDNIEDIKAVLGAPSADYGLAGVEYWGTKTKLVITADATGKVYLVTYGIIE